MTDAVGNTTTLEFDAAGLLVRLLDPAGATTSSPTTTRAAWYGGQPEAAPTSSATRRAGESPAAPTRQKASGAPCREHGAVRAITGAAGQTLRYRYDHIGNVTELIGPDGAASGRSTTTRPPGGAFAPDGTGSGSNTTLPGRVVAVTDPPAERIVGRSNARAHGPITAPDDAVTRWTYHRAARSLPSRSPTVGSGAPRSTRSAASSP